VIAAVIVTHNAQAWLPALLDSIAQQTQPVDEIIVIDDHSADQTRAILASHGITARPAISTGVGLTRIAQNFQHGVQLAQEHEYVVLGDHDDVWHQDRVASQVGVLKNEPLASMVASDGQLIDHAGQRLEGTLRGGFPIDAKWAHWTAEQQLRYALRHSVATGGASALRPARLPQVSIPSGWLHDRWWSLASLVSLGLIVDHQVVIDYRITDAQQVGLDVGSQQRSGLGKLAVLAQDPVRLVHSFATVHGELRRLCATPQLRDQLSATAIARSLAGS